MGESLGSDGTGVARPKGRPRRGSIKGNTEKVFIVQIVTADGVVYEIGNGRIGGEEREGS
jgi:hypothetical protein